MLSKVNKNKSTPRHTVLKLQNMKDNKTIRKVIVLVCLGSSNTTTDWAAMKNRHSFLRLGRVKSGGWKSRVRVPEWLGEGPLPHPRLLVISSHGGREQGISVESLF